MSETSSGDMLQSLNAAPQWRCQTAGRPSSTNYRIKGVPEDSEPAPATSQICNQQLVFLLSKNPFVRARKKFDTHHLYFKKRRRRLIDRNLGTFPGNDKQQVWRRRVQLCVMWCGVLWTVQHIQIYFLAGWKCVIVPRSTHTVYTVNHNYSGNHDKEAVVHRAVKIIDWEEDTTSLRLC